MAERAKRPILWSFAALFAVAALLLGMQMQSLPTGPEPVAFDSEACADCHMQIGDPHFVAQLQTKDGKVLNFDDPGCLLHYLARHEVPVHAVWFHHLKKSDAWLSRAGVGFLRAEGTPMGYGLGAVEAGTRGALSFDEALQRASRTPLAQGEK